MNVQFGNSFIKSLKTLSWHQSPIYRTFRLFRHDLPSFIKNVWKFRRELWKHRWWDYDFTLMLLKKSLEIQEDGMRTRGWEEQTSLDKKLARMRKVIKLIQNHLDDNFVDRVEIELGELYLSDLKFEKTDNGMYALVDEDTEEQKAHNKLVFKKAHELEEKEWKEIWETIKGKKYKEYKNYDGSDLRTWWD